MTRTDEHVILSFFGWVQFDASNAVTIMISIKSKAMNLLVEVVSYYKQNIGNIASSIYMFSRSHIVFAQSGICISYNYLFMLHWPSPCGERDHSRTIVLLGFTSGFAVQ